MRHVSVISGHPIFTGFRGLRVVNGTPGIGVLLVDCYKDNKMHGN